jgi:hypothetical protein
LNASPPRAYVYFESRPAGKQKRGLDVDVLNDALSAPSSSGATPALAPSFVRSIGASELFETFLVSAIAAILLIRVFLSITGYPTVGGDALHIAHMLWGGLLLLVAQLLLLGFLGGAIRTTAAFIGGVGFGAFIDELGKFLTHDNDYFYRPTFALIYILFILVYLGFRAVHHRSYTRFEYLANALEITHEAVRHDLDPDEKRQAIALLEKCDPRDPIAAALRRVLADVRPLETARPGWTQRIRYGVRAIYRRLIATPWFPTAVVLFFVGHSIFGLIQGIILLPRVAEVLGLVIFAVVLAVALARAYQRRRGRTMLSLSIALAITGVLLVALLSGRWLLPALSWFEWGELAFSVAPALLVLAGIIRLPESRLAAYRMFHRAVLILIFITQFFAFYRDQLLAVLGLLANIVVLATLRAMIQQETNVQAERGG